MSLLRPTPWELHACGDLGPVCVRREDLCAAGNGSPDFSKLRGIEEHLRKTSPPRVGVLDSIHSKAGWGVAWVASHLGIPVEVYYPVTVREGGILDPPVRPFQKCARELGATLHPLPAGMSAVLWHQAKADFLKNHPAGEFLPNGLQFQEAVEATCVQVQTVVSGCPSWVYQPSTMWVVAASSGNIAAGILKGMAAYGFQGLLVVHMGYSRSKTSLRERIHSRAGVWDGAVRVELVDEGWDYAQNAQGFAPFPCNPYYDLKAWQWLNSPDGGDMMAMSGCTGAAFWNIGA